MAYRDAGKRPVLISALALFLAFAGVCGALLSPAFAQSYSFSDVRIEGNDRVDGNSILRFAGIGRGQPVSSGDLNDAYQRIVNSGLFETVEVLPQGGTLLIRVKEYPVVNIINFEGNRRLKDEDLAKIVKTQSRRVYSPAAAEADAAAITEAYRSSGRITVTVDPRIIRRSDNRVDLVFEIKEGKVVEIERLAFVGNRDFTDRRLRQVLQTKQAGLLRTFVQRDTFVPERLELDKQLLRDFYLSRGYIDFQVLDASGDVSRERDAYFVTFTVQEGQRFRFGAISASSDIPEVDAAPFEALLRIRPGVTYSPAIVDANISRLEALAQRQSLNFVKIEPRITRNERDQTLDVDFVISRGEKVFVERIDIEGNTTTLDQVVRRQFQTVEGDPFNPREVRQAAERIRALGYFADAKVDAQPGTADGQVIVNVDVTEQPTGSLSFGASYGATNGVGFAVGLTETNFLGRGQTVGINIGTGTDNVDSSITFVEPAFLGRNLQFTFDAYYNTTNNQNADYNTRSFGITPSISFPVSQYGRLQLRYRLASAEILDVARAAVDDPATPDVDEANPGSSPILIAEEGLGALIKSSLGYSYTFDNRKTGLNPKGGVLLRFGQEFSGLGGDTRSITTNVLAVAETTVLNEDITVRAIFEGGAVKTFGGDGSRVTDRFFGNTKIRGFDPNGLGPRDLGAGNRDALGGNLFAVARFEADFPVGLPEEYGITAGVFADVGSVWSLDNTAGQGGPVDDAFHLRSSVGVSVFWNTPVGPLRFNFAHVIQKESYDETRAFDLTISTKF